MSNQIALSLPVADAKPKARISPVLIVLFLLSYGLFVLLITEQGKTIMSQRVMIQQLLGDSTELSHLKIQIAEQKRAAAQAPAQVQPKKSIPSIQVPPQAQQLSPNGDNQTRPMRQHPPKPASDAQDARRRVFST